MAKVVCYLDVPIALLIKEAFTFADSQPIIKKYETDILDVLPRGSCLSSLEEQDVYLSLSRRFKLTFDVPFFESDETILVEPIWSQTVLNAGSDSYTVHKIVSLKQHSLK